MLSVTRLSACKYFYLNNLLWENFLEDHLDWN